MQFPRNLRQPLSRRRWMTTVGVLSGASIMPFGSLHAQESQTGVEEVAEPTKRLILDLPKTQHWRIGLILKTPVTCSNVFATFPIPRDWPEQKVTLTGQTVDPLISNWEVREVGDGARQVALTMARVPGGSTVELTLQFKIERFRISSSDVTDDLVLPKRGNRKLRPYTGNSPYIDASNARIKRVSRQLAAEEIEGAWQRVEHIYDWVRDNVKYVGGDLKNASVALKDGEGDCEEMTSLFVALCRNARVPARMVWIPGHCYPEFYLEDGKGTGHWFPCQAAGTRQFGQMIEYRPVLQKGDRFKVKETKAPVRYVSEYFKCDKKGKGNPKPNFIRKQIDP